MDRLKSGDVAPDFSAPNEDNVEISLRDFADKFIILYFYPKDNTSGCTTQAQEYSELKQDFESENAVIIGISSDKSTTHKKFIESKNLTIILLSDESKKIATKYHVYGKKMMYGKEVMGIIRSSFIIKNGKILESFYNVKAKRNAQKVLEALKKIKRD